MYAFQSIVDGATMNSFIVYSSELHSFTNLAKHYMSFRLHLENKSFLRAKENVGSNEC